MGFTLTLVRHGESEANVRHVLSGWMDVALTDHGREELARLRDEMDYPRSEAYFSSPLRRCIDTCRILFPDADPTISDDFREISFRSLEGHVLSTPEAVSSYFASWVEDEPYADEETISPVMERGREAFLKVVRECHDEGKSSATVITHSGIMRSSVIALFGLDRHEFLRMAAPNGEGYIILFDERLTPVDFRSIPRKMH